MCGVCIIYLLHIWFLLANSLRRLLQVHHDYMLFAVDELRQRRAKLVAKWCVLAASEASRRGIQSASLLCSSHTTSHFHEFLLEDADVVCVVVEESPDFLPLEMKKAQVRPEVEGPDHSDGDGNEHKTRDSQKCPSLTKANDKAGEKGQHTDVHEDNLKGVKAASVLEHDRSSVDLGVRAREEGKENVGEKQLDDEAHGRDAQAKRIETVDGAVDAVGVHRAIFEGRANSIFRLQRGRKHPQQHADCDDHVRQQMLGLATSEAVV